MIAVDTNLLVYAHRPEMPWHEAAVSLLTELAEGKESFAIPWPCVHEFLAVVTHPRIFKRPTPVAIALEAVTEWQRSPRCVLLTEAEGYLERLGKLLTSARISGAKVHDARVAALCLLHGVSELWSADRDYGSFPELSTRNPLVG